MQYVPTNSHNKIESAVNSAVIKNQDARTIRLSVTSV